jgi:hypothetical protein
MCSTKKALARNVEASKNSKNAVVDAGKRKKKRKKRWN